MKETASNLNFEKKKRKDKKKPANLITDTNRTNQNITASQLSLNQTAEVEQ